MIKMENRKSFKFLKVVFILTLIFVSFEAFTQCPMCRAAAEQNLAEGHDASKGLNRGIMYLFLTPYTIVVTIGAIWYMRYRKMKNV